MKRIWAPWRIQYIETPKTEGCILCSKPGETNDKENYILHRGKTNFVMLNGYPYNPGHLMVAPYRHLANIDALTDDERDEHFKLVSCCVGVLREVFKPGGFNLGMNLGKVAGAGIEGHCHSHIVPRWQGDTNFMPIFSDVRILPEALADTYQKLQGKF